MAASRSSMTISAYLNHFRICWHPSATGRKPICLPKISSNLTELPTRLCNRGHPHAPDEWAGRLQAAPQVARAPQTQASHRHASMTDRNQSSRLDRLLCAVEHAAHLLPWQGPIGVFVHHNTLHAFEHLPFEEAVIEASHLFGAEPYMSECSGAGNPGASAGGQA
jgi:hypothetical protein